MNRKQQIIKELRQEAGGSAFISKAGIQRYLGIRKANVAGVVEGLEKLESGKAHRYHVTDVAERIVEMIH